MGGPSSPGPDDQFLSGGSALFADRVGDGHCLDLEAFEHSAHFFVVVDADDHIALD